METLKELTKLVEKYDLNGCFETSKKQRLSEIFGNKIPEELDHYGVYFFTDELDKDEIVYIGKNGTLKNDGKFGNHTLKKRIMQGKLKTEWLTEKSYKVYWFVTVKKGSEISPKNIPGFVESKLLKKYFQLEGRLPKYNNSF